MWNVQFFLQVFPEFGDISEERIQAVHDFHADLLNVYAFGKWYDKAVMLLVAHRLATQYNIAAKATQEGVSSPAEFGSTIASRSAATNSLSESYGTSQFSNSTNPLYFDLSKTRYGVQLLELIELLMAGGMLVRSGCPFFSSTFKPELGPCNG